MSKVTIKVELNSEIIASKKFSLNDHLDSIREKVTDKVNQASFLDKDGNPVRLFLFFCHYQYIYITF